jgi:transcriptional regulator of acetoin/glycerol metabolism
LENFVKYVLSTLDHDTLVPRDLPDHIRQRTGSGYPRNPIAKEKAALPDRDLSREPAESLFAGVSWDRLQRDYVLYLLHKNRWNITRAAMEAGVNRSTFDSRMKKLGIQKTRRSE